MRLNRLLDVSGQEEEWSLLALDLKRSLFLHPRTFVRTELSLLGSYGSTTGEIQSVIDLVASGKLNLSESITERFPLEEVNKALDHLHKKIGNPIRIVIEIDR